MSVSRVGSAAQIKAMKQVSGSIKLDLAQFREMEAFSQFASDLDQSTRKLLERGRRLTEILKQSQYSPLSVEQQIVVIFAGVNGYLDEIDLQDITKFESDLLSSLKTEGKDILSTIESEQTISDKLKPKIEDFISNISQKYKKESI